MRVLREGRRSDQPRPARDPDHDLQVEPPEPLFSFAFGRRPSTGRLSTASAGRPGVRRERLRPCVPGWARAEAAMSAACCGWGWWSGAWPGSLLLVVAASLCLSTRQESLSRPGCICAEKERVA